MSPLQWRYSLRIPSAMRYLEISLIYLCTNIFMMKFYALFILFLPLFSIAKDRDEKLLLYCTSKIPESSQIKPMSPSDIHIFIINYDLNRNLLVYRGSISTDNFVVNFVDARVDSSLISGKKSNSLININRLTGKFSFHQIFEQINSSVYYSGECTKYFPEAKF